MTSTPVPHSHIPFGDPGAGTFGVWLAEQDAASIAIMQDKILQTVATVPVRNSNTAFTIADYGTADGSASMGLIRAIISQVKNNQKDVPVQVVYEDQYTNDFNSLFKRVHGMIPVPRTYLKDFNDVFVTASGTGFFQQILPPQSGDVIMSFLSAHYLSQPVTKYQDSFHRFPNGTTAECKLAEAQAAKDWENFLIHRANELRSGGVMIVSTAAADPAGSMNGVTHWAQNMEEGMLNMWRRMRDEGKITKEEFLDTNFHRCCKTLEEYKAPFMGNNSAVRRAGLELISAELVLIPCVAQQAWRNQLEKEGKDEREAWAKAVVQQHRCWSNSNYIRGLSNSRSESEKDALVFEMFDRLEKEVAQQNPNEFKNDYVVGYVMARKV